MNYRHSFHAGNFADVLKHAVLARIVLYLQNKEKPFRVLDTHAGRGLYDLGSDAAQRTGEWREGIAKLRAAKLSPEVQTLLQPYLGTLLEERAYPGSPLVSRRLLRKQDRLTAVELHPEEAEALKALFAGDIQTRVIHLDGWLALGAQVPPKEKRGLVLVDPPFEQPQEFDRMADGLADAHRRWPGGTYALWYPIKHLDSVERFRERLAAMNIPRILDAQLLIRAPSAEPRLDGCGMVVVNPPFTLPSELDLLLPTLAGLLAQGPGALGRAVWLAGDTPGHPGA
ncbi:MAG: 23S rRNA (adenine(2030)-N(6))-methyltransferase RlmJ [Mesorhizobium amorphae]|nr:MAG: 23S rRNA (adenine(2030)-N(6))-methyltransferase RlmJ [Mesorhizobium amorphae]